MKFRDKKTGRLFDDSLEAVGSFCDEHTCSDCPLHRGAKCMSVYIGKNVEEVAAIIGCEIIEEAWQ